LIKKCSYGASKTHPVIIAEPDPLLK